MNPITRRLIECIKNAKEISLVLNPNDPANRIRLDVAPDRRFSHEVAIAYQELEIKLEKKHKNK